MLPSDLIEIMSTLGEMIALLSNKKDKNQMEALRIKLEDSIRHHKTFNTPFDYTTLVDLPIRYPLTYSSIWYIPQCKKYF